jgi:hypothetical protein
MMKAPTPGAAPAQPGRRSALVKLALLGASLATGLGACGGGGGTAKAPVRLAAESYLEPVQVNVGFRSVSTARPIDSRFSGLSYEKRKLTEPLFSGVNLPLIKLFSLVGPGVLRIGANDVDRASWNGAEDDLTPILPAQIDNLAAFLQQTQWQVIYGVNMRRNTPADAASEAAYVASRLGPSLLAWEIGNEPDLYIRRGYRPEGWTYDDYLREWRQLRDAMREAAPAVPFSGPATSYDVERFTLPFARDEGVRVPLLTHHYYRGDRDDPNSTLELLLRPDPALARELETLVAAASAAGMNQGVRLAEANSFFGGGVAGVSNAFGSALWVLDFLFTCALAGCTGVNLHGGDAGSYTPIAERDGVVIEVRPEFYAMLMFAEAEQGVPVAGVIEPTPDINLSAWGVQRPDGGLNVILVNKDEGRGASMTLNTGPFTTAIGFDPLWLYGPARSATAGQTLGASVIGADGSWTPITEAPAIANLGLFNVVVPAASAVLLRSL